MANPTSRRFCFTINNPTTLISDTLAATLAHDRIRYAVVGKEVGTSGTPHLQGFVIFTNAVRFTQIRLLIPGHISIARGTSQQAADYCKKDNDFTEYGVFPAAGGKRTDIDDCLAWAVEFESDNGRPPSSPELAVQHPSIYLRCPRMVRCLVHRSQPIQLEFGEPRPWQRELDLALQADPDDRHVQFYIDETGGKGKTWFQRWYMTNHPRTAQVLCIGKRDDLAHAIVNTNRVFFFNIQKQSMEFLRYEILEALKDRMIFSPKYASTMKYLPHNCHVVVFANEYPDMTKMSQDRFVIKDLRNEE